jgi:AcrR family transcriptional regulator
MTDTTPGVRREDTRTRIQEIALEMFTEKGYDATSLREISERLGFSKAALYYHFKSKEEIVESMTADHIARIEALIEWAGDQAASPDTRREFIRRYMESLSISKHFRVMKFFQQNQPALKHMANAAKWREIMDRMVQTLTGTNVSAQERLRVGLALFGLHVSWMLLPEDSYSEQERNEAALATAYDLLDTKS